MLAAPIQTFVFRGFLLLATLLVSGHTYAQYLGGIGDGSFNAAAVSAVAPLDLLSFDATNADASTHLEWKTANEEDTERFLIERSTDGRTFEAIGQTPAAGYSAPGQEVVYFYEDAAPPSGQVYYRLLVVDLDGSEQYSDVVSVRHAAPEAAFEIYPNPGSGKSMELQLRELPGHDPIYVEVVDATARRPIENHVIYAEGSRGYVTFTNRLPAGSYLVRLHTDRLSLSPRLLVVAD